MNIRKSMKSMHYNSTTQFRKMQLNQINQLDFKQSNLYTQSAQSTKQSQNSILNKLLLQPPSMKNQQNKKLTLNNKKYQPKFQKPDPQNLIQQNINLKNTLSTANHTISLLKIKNSQLQRKIKLLQRGLQKVQNYHIKSESINQNKQSVNISKKNSVHMTKNNKINDYKQNIDQDRNDNKGDNYKIKKDIILGSIQNYTKTGPVHTQILKKKIADLTAMNVSAQNQLKFLKKLPNITIYEQNDVQKQHLIAQAIRLKAIITSLSQQQNQSQQNKSQKFQNQFMRLMKEQNQKLKATIRLLQNDKILLKSRQTIQNKLNIDLKKQIQQLKSKLLYKQSQLQKINNQNKNLLFKKTTQFRQQQQRKQNQIITDLKNKILSLQNQKLTLQENNQFYLQENINLKQKQKILHNQLQQNQNKYDLLVKKLNQQIQELQFQLNNVKNDYINLLNAGSIKKKKSLGLNKQNSNIPNSYHYIRDQNKHPSSLFQKVSLHNTNNLYLRPVKWHDIFLAMAHVYITLEQNPFLTVDAMIKSVQQNDKVKCVDLVLMFIDEPFNINKKQGIKLARYICEDSSISSNEKILYNENITIQSMNAKTILTASLDKITQKASQQYIRKWSVIFNKKKKLYTIIQSLIQNKQTIKKQQIIQIIDKNSRDSVDLQMYDYLILKSFNKQLSQEEFILDTDKIIFFMEQVKEYSNKNHQNNSN